jgi:RNA polymerase sigma-70 factor, ECF subfamily
MENFTVFNLSSADISQYPGLPIEVIVKAKQGDQAAFAEIYNHYFKKIYQFVYYRIGHKEAAEDLCEEVFLKAYGKISTINSDASFVGWLYQIARNKVIDYYRDKKQVIALEEVENFLEYESNIVDLVNLDQQQKVLLELIKRLGPDQQTVLKLKFLEDLDNAEIAAILNKSEGSIRVIQHRAIQKLQEIIKQQNLQTIHIK